MEDNRFSLPDLPTGKTIGPADIDWKKIDRANAIRFWVPVVISIIALAIAIASLIIQVQDRELKQAKQPPKTQR